MIGRMKQNTSPTASNRTRRLQAQSNRIEHFRAQITLHVDEMSAFT